MHMTYGLDALSGLFMAVAGVELVLAASSSLRSSFLCVFCLSAPFDFSALPSGIGLASDMHVYVYMAVFPPSACIARYPTF